MWLHRDRHLKNGLSKSIFHVIEHAIFEPHTTYSGGVYRVPLNLFSPWLILENQFYVRKEDPPVLTPKKAHRLELFLEICCFTCRDFAFK